MPANPTTSAVLATLQGYAAWALVRMGDDDTVLAVGGSRSEVASLLDVPLEHGSPDEGRTADRLLAIPFRQVTERGFEAHDDGTPLVVVDIDFERQLPLGETLGAIADDGIEFLDRGGFESDDEEYAGLVEGKLPLEPDVDDDQRRAVVVCVEAALGDLPERDRQQPVGGAALVG